MKLTRFPFLALTLSALAATSQAQVSSHTVRSIDAYGNVVTTQVQTPLADARSVAGFIAQQGIRGSNTTTSTTVRYGNVQQNYCPPTYPYGYQYGYPYGYPAAVSNNYYYPQLPSTTMIAPPAHSWAQPAWVTNIPLGNSYSAPAYPGYGYPADPYGYGQGYYQGYNQGYGSIVTNGNGYSYVTGIQVGGVPRDTTTTTTTVTSRTGAPSDFRRTGNTLGYTRVGNKWVPLMPSGANGNPNLPNNR